MANLKFESAFFGPNPFADRAVLVARLTLDDAEQAKGFARGALALRTHWPEWFDAAPDEAGGAAAVPIASTAARWALGALNEVRGHLQDAGAREDASGAALWVGFHHPAVSRAALDLAFRALGAAASMPTFSPKLLADELRKLWDLCRQRHPDYQARILMQAADSRGIPYLPFIEGSKYWQYGWGAKSRIFHESASNADGFLAGLVQRSKVLSKAAFAALGVPTPPHVVVHKADELAKAAQAIGWPCVLKPIDGSGGKGVTAGVRTPETMQQALVVAQRGNPDAPVMVEAYVAGEDNRLMVIDGKLVAAIRREPSSVVGDGASTILQLVAQLNSVRSPNMVKSRYLRPIPIDDILRRHLATQGVELDTVLASGRKARLRSNSNLSTGGICIDVTAQVHPQVRQFAESISQAFGIDSAGLDYMTTDIGESPAVSGGRFIEANLMPGLDATIAAGWDPIDIGVAALGAKPGRIPVSLFVIAKAEIERVLDALQAAKHTAGAGWVCGTNSGVGSLVLGAGTGEPWSAVRRVLRLPRVKRVDIVLAAEELVQQGLPLDRFDRVVVCGAELPAAWLEALNRCTAVVEDAPAWTPSLLKAS